MTTFWTIRHLCKWMWFLKIMLASVSMRKTPNVNMSVYVCVSAPKLQEHITSFYIQIKLVSICVQY